jgi:hypothetical protein
VTTGPAAATAVPTAQRLAVTTAAVTTANHRDRPWERLAATPLVLRDIRDSFLPQLLGGRRPRPLGRAVRRQGETTLGCGSTTHKKL